MTIFWQGIAVGFTAAAAIGPIALLLVQRTLSRGVRVGLVSGIGVALADGLYGLIGGLGLTVLTSFLVSQQTWLRLVGGLVLIYLGTKTLRSVGTHHVARKETFSATGYMGALVSIFLLTLSNPVTILYFSAVYAGLGAQMGAHQVRDALIFGGAVFAGSVTWWVILVSLIHTMSRRFRLDTLTVLNRLSGLVIAGFGVWILLNLWLG